jgi:hypothetical protein
MAKDQVTIDILENFGEAVVQRAMSNLRVNRSIRGKSRNRVATGNLMESLTYKLKVRNNKYTMDFTTKSFLTKQYADVIEYGRRPNSKAPPSDAIYDWLKIRKIRLRNQNGQFIKTTESRLKSAAWTIAQSIGKKGIVGIRYFGEAIAEEIDKRGEDFFDLLSKQLEKRLLLNQRTNTAKGIK